MRDPRQVRLLSAHLEFLLKKRALLGRNATLIDRLKDECDAWVREKDDGKTSFTDLLHRCMDLTDGGDGTMGGQLTSLECQEIRKAIDTYKTLTARLETLETSISSMKNVNNLKEQRNSELKKTMEVLEATIQAQDTKIDSLAIVQSLKTKDLMTKLEDYQLKNDEIVKKKVEHFDEAMEELCANNLFIFKLQKQNDCLNHNLNTLKRQVNEFLESVSEDIANLELNQEEFSKKFLETEQFFLQKEIVNAEKFVGTLSRFNDKAEAEFVIIKRRLQELEKQKKITFETKSSDYTEQCWAWGEQEFEGNVDVHVLTKHPTNQPANQSDNQQTTRLTSQKFDQSTRK